MRGKRSQASQAQSDQPDRIAARGLSRLWQRLLEPSALVQAAGAQRQARLLAGLLLVFTLLAGAGAVASLLGGSHTGFVLSGVAVLSASAYVLSRTSHYTLASVLAMGVINLAAFVAVLLEPTDIVRTLLSFLPLVFILSSALLSVRSTAVLTGLNVAGILSLRILIPGAAFADIISGAGIIGTLGGLVLLTSRHRNLIESERSAEVMASVRELRTLRSSLEHRVADLGLASEVGRQISQVHDLDILLANAVELIRAHFNLYYTQIYLVDSGRRTLVLRAGTGATGLELMRRTHRLPIDPGSLNGRAAVERRAVIVANTQASVTFKPNPLLPDTRSEMAVPLIVADQVVGVLDLQSDKPESLSQEELPAFEALAGQLAVAIDNARLIAEAQQARVEVELQAGRLTRTGWQAFLDAVNRSEQLGYTYDRQTLTPLTEPLPPNPGAATLDVPVAVAGIAIGRIQLERDADAGEAWSEDAAELVTVIATHVARQIENLRLLAQVEQYRVEAEAATRRLTREGWESYFKTVANEPEFGYDYDRGQVRPLAAGAQDVTAPTVIHPLKVREETIGELAVAGAERLDEAATEIVAAVADRLSVHIENLRLTEQTQRALFETEDQTRRLSALSELSQELSQAENQDGILKLAAVKANRIFPADLVSAALITPSGEAFRILAFERDQGATLLEPELPLDQTTVGIAVREQRVVIIPDTETSDLLDIRRVRSLFRSTMCAPLIVAGQAIGALNVASQRPNVYGMRDMNLMLQTVSLLAATIENRRLIEQTRKRAVELETVAQVSATASSVLAADQLLQVVVDLVKASFNLYHAHIYLIDKTAPVLNLAAGAGEVGRRMVEAGRRIPLSHERSLVARAARTREGVIVNDVRETPDFLPNPLLPDARAELAVPLIVGERLLGVLDVQSDVVNHFTEEDVRIQVTLAAQVAVALHNANLYAEQTATVARLRELDHLKSSFLANMSHELRTPLNSILGFSDVILAELDGPLNDQMRSDLMLISKNGQHLLSLINDVLDMAKIEAGRMNLSIERFKLHEVFEEVLEIAGPLARNKSLELQIDPASAGELELEADHVRLRQVMINLVGNAVKFTDSGGITLHSVQNNGHVLISVRDTGIGIPPEQTSIVFEEFRQADTSTTRKAGGTGLGLPISKRLIEIHGGRLWVESTGIPGEGSTFFIELPMKPGDLSSKSN